MKKHNIIKVVLITILVLMLFTWILPAAYFSSEYIEQGRIQMGIFDLFNYPVTALSYFGHIALFILMVGGFYGILYQIPAYHNFLTKISDKLQKNGKLAISVMMVLIAVVTSVCGLQIGILVFFPMLISIIILMGYNKMVAALSLVGSTIVGLAGTTFAYSNTSIVLSVLGLDITYELLTKIIVLVLGLVLLIFNTIVFIRKSELLSVSKEKEMKKSESLVSSSASTTKKVTASKTKSTKVLKTSDSKKSTKSTKTVKSTKSSKKDIKAAVKDEEIIVVKENLSDDNDYLVPLRKDNKKHSIWPFVVSFVLLFVVVVLAFISWSTAFKMTAFTKATASVLEFKLFGFPIFGKILGTVNEFGSWTIVDITVGLFFVILFLSIVYKMKMNDIVNGFVKGAKKALPLCIVTVLVYTCLVITTYHPFQLVIYKALFGLSKDLDVFITMFTGILAGVFNVEPLYAFQSVLPYLASSTSDSSLYPIIGVLFQTVYGLSMLVAPTSVVLMCVLAYLDIPYTKWLKVIWKLFVQLCAVFAILFAISGLSFIIGLAFVIPVIICILMIVAYWKIFQKALKKGYAAIIPFYSQYTLFEVAGYNGWLFLLLLIPVVNIVFMVLVNIKIAKKFGKGTRFILGLIFLPFIFYMILAYGSAKYNKNK